MKIGAVSVLLNTLWKSQDYAYTLKDSRARLIIISEPLLAALEPALAASAFLKHVLIVCQPA